MPVVLESPWVPKATQKHRFVAVSVENLADDALLLHRMQAFDHLGQLFEYRLELLSEDNDIDLDTVLGRNMTVRVETITEGAATRYYNGYVSDFRYAGIRGRHAVYRAVLRPWLWFLTHNIDCRIFQNQTVPDLIMALFRERGFSGFENRLSGHYRPRDYCVQYRETDFNFISRLMEQEGIYYYFKHQNGFHLVVLADGYGSHQKVRGYADIPYYPPDPQHHRQRDHIFDWAVGKQVQTGACALSDFDFKAPRKNLDARRAMENSGVSRGFELFDFPGQYAEHDQGDDYVRVRLEALAARREIVQGQAKAQGLLAGALFALSRYPRADQNDDYLVVSTDYELRAEDYETGQDGNGGYHYQCRFAAIRGQQAFRSPLATPKPVVQGPQTAIVVGKSGEEIWTDKYGRVKVQFHWDRYGKADETSSCWIRVSQNWAGKRWGALFLPRIGQEVIVDFLEGDPDRPIITGRVYNGGSMPPYDLPANATLSTLKSCSSKGGGGFNEIRFQDKKDEEQLFIHAQRNQDVRVKNDCFEWTGRNRHLIVKQDRFEHVENNRHELVGHDHHERIENDRHLQVGGKQAISIQGSHSFTVHGDAIEVFQSGHSQQITGNSYLKAQGIVIEAVSGITLKCGGTSVVIGPEGITLKGALLTLDGGLVKINSGPGSPPLAGTPGLAVTPASPKSAEEADKADPGEMAEVIAKQRQTQTGKYGRAPVKPFVPVIPEGGYRGYFRPRSSGGSGGAPVAPPASPPPRPTANSYQPLSTALDPTTRQTLITDTPPRPVHWIEIELVDEASRPVPGAKYEITMPDQTVKQGTLDEKGWARVDGIKDPGQCQITFPDLDREAWDFMQSLGPRTQ
ncbi:MAG: type VI secretion system tip protein VgrG [Candidatus Competibacteraceae bacterium]|nr:type VI secretion system tip protein VgrG [Candidatus Competibacteraceae bacterium]